jgi:hypothetical protein
LKNENKDSLVEVRRMLRQADWRVIETIVGTDSKYGTGSSEYGNDVLKPLAAVLRNRTIPVRSKLPLTSCEVLPGRIAAKFGSTIPVVAVAPALPAAQSAGSVEVVPVAGFAAT